MNQTTFLGFLFLKNSGVKFFCFSVKVLCKTPFLLFDVKAMVTSWCIHVSKIFIIVYGRRILSLQTVGLYVYYDVCVKNFFECIFNHQTCLNNFFSYIVDFCRYCIYSFISFTICFYFYGYCANIIIFREKKITCEVKLWINYLNEQWSCDCVLLIKNYRFSLW